MPEVQGTFAERKAAQLREERGAQPVEQQPRDVTDPIRTPDTEAESAEQVDDSQDLLVDDDAPEGEAELTADPDDGTPAEDDSVEPEADNVNWEKRYKDTQAALTELQQGREEFQNSLLGETEAAQRSRFEFEDAASELRRNAEFFANVMAGNANQYRNINWSTIPPEQVQAVQEQARTALQQEQQAKQALEFYNQQIAEQESKIEEREAQVANLRLRRTIPGWGQDTYNSIRDFAMRQKGMTERDFARIRLMPAVLEALHDSYNLHNASSVERTVSSRKQSKPARRNAKRQPRDARGKFSKAQAEFQNNPGQPGSFAEMKRHQLALEREGR